MIFAPQRNRRLACLAAFAAFTGLMPAAPLEQPVKDPLCTSTNGQACKSPSNRAAFLTGQKVPKSLSITNSPATATEVKTAPVKPAQ